MQRYKNIENLICHAMQHGYESLAKDALDDYGQAINGDVSIETDQAYYNTYKINATASDKVTENTDDLKK